MPQYNRQRHADSLPYRRSTLKMLCHHRVRLQQYHQLLQHILDNGATKTDRTGTGTTSVLNLNNIYLEDASKMTTVTVTARRPPVVINGDSIEFNAENFKTPPNAVVEDLLKKMPGIEVDKSGGITVNGKTVTKVFVNGKEFFTGDPKMATKNLPADAIDKIQVYDRKSDQAMFTGIDDGTEETAINLKVKKRFIK